MNAESVRVLVLGGGPDAEREVSLASSQAVAGALARGGRYRVEYRVIGRPSADELEGLPGDVVFPVLHGSFGEGGPLQEMLEASGRPFVGCGSSAARRAMDKMGTKLAGASVGVPTGEACVLDVTDAGCPLPLPVVVKPNNDGSSVGLHLCRSVEAWDRAHAAARDGARAHPGRAYMVERLIAGRELTVGVVGVIGGGLEALPVVEIEPAEGVYDYEAKYRRSDTRYTVGPELPAGVGERMAAWAMAVAGRVGVRDVARVDFMLPAGGEPMLLEVNTMPGFTATSLLPKAAAAVGMDLPALCERLVDLALDRPGA